MDQSTAEKRSAWRAHRWRLMPLVCALILVVGSMPMPYPLDRIWGGVGILGVVWTVGQSACHAVSIWFVRNGLELYFDTCWHGDCRERGKEMTPRNFRKWARAQGGRYWWRVLRKRHARRDKRGRPCR